MSLPRFLSPALVLATLLASTTALLAATPTPDARQQQVQHNYGKLPVHFEANAGQTDARVRFFARGNGYGLFVTPTEATLALQAQPGRTQARGNAATPRRAVLKFQLLGSNPKAPVQGEERLPGVVNYLLGRDPEQWRTNVATYAQVRSKQVYRGIDVVWHGLQRQLEYDFVVSPGADPSQIRLRIAGAKRLQVEKDGGLRIETSTGVVRQGRPVLSQAGVGEKRQMVSGGYKLLGKGVVSFWVGEYFKG